VIVGTERKDRIVIRPARRGDEFIVRVNRERHGPFDAAIVDRILVNGHDGEDAIRMSRKLDATLVIHDEPAAGTPRTAEVIPSVVAERATLDYVTDHRQRDRQREFGTERGDLAELHLRRFGNMASRRSRDSRKG